MLYVPIVVCWCTVGVKVCEIVLPPSGVPRVPGLRWENPKPPPIPCCWHEMVHFVPAEVHFSASSRVHLLAPKSPRYQSLGPLLHLRQFDLLQWIFRRLLLVRHSRQSWMLGSSPSRGQSQMVFNLRHSQSVPFPTPQHIQPRIQPHPRGLKPPRYYCPNQLLQRVCLLESNDMFMANAPMCVCGIVIHWIEVWCVSVSLR